MNKETSEEYKTEPARFQQLLKTGKIKLTSDSSFNGRVFTNSPTDPEAYEIKDGKIFLKPEYLKDLC